MPYTYPTSSLDDPAQIADLFGNFWTEIFPDHALVQDFLGALGQLEEETIDRFYFLLASLSRQRLPIYRARRWFSLVLQQSVGQVSGNTYTWPLPQRLVALPALFNRIDAPSLSLICDVDYSVDAGQITFQSNPFTSPNVVLEPTDIAQTDFTLQLWGYRATFDAADLYKQYGYALGFQLPSSIAYQTLLNALYDAAVAGSTRRAIANGMTALTGVPFASGAETVEAIFTDALYLWVVTDQTAYSFNLAATPLVAVGATVVAGQPLVDTVQIFEINNGQIPPGLSSLTIAAGLLSEGFGNGLTFDNIDVPWIIEQDEHGRTRLSFQLGGPSATVEAFWDYVHSAGVASGLTLARLLDQRQPVFVEHELLSFSASAEESFSEAPPELMEPDLAALPTSVNPLGFLLRNVLCNNAVLILVKPSTFGKNALGLGYQSMLRQLVPPQTLAVVVNVDTTPPATATGVFFPPGFLPLGFFPLGFLP